MPSEYFIAFVAAISTVVLAGPGIGLLVRTWKRRRIARSWAKLAGPALAVDERSHASGLARIAATHGSRIVAGADGSDPRIEGSAIDLATGDGRRYRVKLDGVKVRIDPSVAEDCARELVGGDMVSVWRLEEGDVVEIAGLVVQERAREGYREPGQGAVLRTHEPGKLDVHLRRRASAR